MGKRVMTTASTNGSGVKGAAQAPTDPAVRELIHNALLSRSELWRRFLDPRRDIDDECGYPRGRQAVSAETYQLLYEREPVAARVVQVLPQACWQVQPTVYETEDADTVTEFEEAWAALGESLYGGHNWYASEEGGPVWEALKRLDTLSGIGHYGVLLLGIDDGKDLRQPAALREPRSGKGKAAKKVKAVEDEAEVEDSREGRKVSPQSSSREGRKLLYLRAFPEYLAQITRFDSDPTSERYGQPEEYLLTFNDPRESAGGVGLVTGTFAVHWTRVIHVADNQESSVVFGVPRMRPVLNRLLDLRKLYGGSAEMYWRGAFPGYSLETHPQLGGDTDVNPTELRDMMEQYMNGLQRYLALIGMSAKSLAPQVVDPKAQIEVQLDAICIQLDIPKRKFLGSERGELASSQDDGDWNDRLRERQHSHLTPCVVCPFINRLIALGVLPEPAEGYRVEWPDLNAQTAEERAQVALTETQAISTYVSSGSQTLIPPLDWLTRVLDWTEEEAQAVLDRAAAALEEGVGLDEGGSASPLVGVVGGLTGMIELFKLAKEGGLSEEQLKQQLMLFYGLDETRAEALIADGLPEPAAVPTPAESGGLPSDTLEGGASASEGTARPVEGEGEGKEQEGGKGEEVRNLWLPTLTNQALPALSGRPSEGTFDFGAAFTTLTSNLKAFLQEELDAMQVNVDLTPLADALRERTAADQGTAMVLANRLAAFQSRPPEPVPVVVTLPVDSLVTALTESLTTSLTASLGQAPPVVVTVPAADIAAAVATAVGALPRPVVEVTATPAPFPLAEFAAAVTQAVQALPRPVIEVSAPTTPPPSVQVTPEVTVLPRRPVAFRIEVDPATGTKRIVPEELPPRA